MNCDFRENNLKNERTKAEECGPRCRATNDCTHFTWTSWEQGTCWMKRNSVSKNDAFEKNTDNAVCGVLDNGQANFLLPKNILKLKF